MTYIFYIALFLILYRLVKQGFIDFVCDLCVCTAHTVATIIRIYKRLRCRHRKHRKGSTD